MPDPPRPAPLHLGGPIQPGQSPEMLPMPVRGSGSGSVLLSIHPLQGLDEDVSVDLTPRLTACPRSEPPWQKKRNSQEKPRLRRLNRAGAAWPRCRRARALLAGPITMIKGRAAPAPPAPAEGMTGTQWGGAEVKSFSLLAQPFLFAVFPYVKHALLLLPSPAVMRPGPAGSRLPGLLCCCLLLSSRHVN